MTRPIQQSVILKAAPRELFNTFLDSKKHAALTGAPATLGKKAGATLPPLEANSPGAICWWYLAV